MSKENNIDDVSDSIGNACIQCGEFDIGGISLDNPDARLLDISDSNLSEHVAMQPAAIAYYGSMMKEASRKLEIVKRDMELQNKRWYAIAKTEIKAVVAKPTIADIEAFIADRFSSEISEWNKRMDRAQSTLDNLSVWYDAWKQKGFNLKGYVSVTEDERYSSNTGSDSIGENDVRTLRTVLNK